MENIMKKLCVAILAMALAWSCGKDDGPAPVNNTAPVIKAQEFTVAEDIPDTQTIGTVVASDADSDALTFSIKTNDDDLFEISDTGVLSLAPGKNLDFATKALHTITVEVTDGEDASSATITVKVTETVPQNSAPEIADQGFSVAEDANDIDTIGVVTANDVDGDTLTFSIITNDSNLFLLSAGGELYLASGKQLDFETTAEHSITVQVSDGTATAQATVTITVEDVYESLASDPNAFVTTWRTEVDNEEIVIGANNGLTYDYTIDWGDGTVEEITASESPSHVYVTAGDHTVAILGQFPAIGAENATSEKLLSIDQWGNIQWETMYGAFAYCENMTYKATDTPNLSQVTDMSYMFLGAAAFNGDIGDWNVGNVTNMIYMFWKASSFNGDISAWDVNNVVNMDAMFYQATAFNQNIGGWGTFSLESTSYMFEGATSFNQPIDGWDTFSVTDMVGMFSGATAFDQNIGGWDIRSVESMTGMFNGSGMSTANFSGTIIGWSTFVEQNGGPSGITIGVDGRTFCGDGIAAANNLLNNWNWTFAGNYSLQANCN